jgi:ATP-binding cassette subfamily C protein
VIFFDHLKQLVHLLRWRIAAALLLLLSTGLLESAGLLLLVPLLGAIGLDVQQGPVSRLSAATRRALSVLGVQPTLTRVLIVFVLVNVLLSMIRRAHTILTTAVEQDVVRRTAERLYSAIVHMDWLSFTRMRASDLTVALTSECDRVGLAASQLLSLGAAAVVALVYAGLAFRISPAMSLVVFALGVTILVLLRRRTRTSATLGDTYAEVVREYQAVICDDLAGMKIIKSFVAADRSAARFAALAERLGRVRIDSIGNYAGSTLWVEVASVASLSTLVFVAVAMLNFDATSLLLLLFLFARIVPRVAALQHNVNYYASVLPSVRRVAELEERCLAAGEPRDSACRDVTLRSRLEVESIAFRYDATGPAILSDVSLTIAAGEIVAIVGPSGSGKTTLSDIVMGLLSPVAGRILVDGEPLTDHRRSGWRRQVAYVAQETFLFHDTIRANLLWAVPAATDEEIAAALAMASATFVYDLPQGLSTVVGDRGIRLSGGERQRLALARAMLRRPSLLVLDEPTNALDTENERKVFEAVGRLRGGTTVLLVTHRLATVAIADTIHVLDAGRIVQSGSWASLNADGWGRFDQLRRAQQWHSDEIPRFHPARAGIAGV